MDEKTAAQAAVNAYREAGLEPPRWMVTAALGKAGAMLSIARADIAKQKAKENDPRELARRAVANGSGPASGTIPDPEVRQLLRAIAIRNGSSRAGLEENAPEPFDGPSATPANPVKAPTEEKYNPVELAAEISKRAHIR
ncbi:exonuclease [Streptomyces sp. NBRC 110611]|uniref:hypothetical protein n=1 Tax=Streptomyces sp. NBRC 110611 TaxID=1621259 RepID=UPI000855F096|nr:hypothetical protein [Streptomyces sp. NBRC 110611]GAU69919.1 exonuclease [Streptomyces sp. NBRC 110611]